MEAEDSSETLVPFYQTTQRRVLEERNYTFHNCENLKYHIVM